MFPLSSVCGTDIIETNDPQVVIERVKENLPFITSLEFSPDGRLFFLAKNSGTVRYLDVSTGEISNPVIQVQPVAAGLEAGAVGLAFDPDFDSDEGGRVYVSHVVSDATWRISSFDENGRGVGGNLQTVIDFPDCLPGEGFFDRQVHNIENIHFGPNPISTTPEEVLFVSCGDGGIPTAEDDLDPHPSLSPGNWCGGIYFLDPANPPLVNDATSHNFCLGVRNAFDFEFHPKSGALYFTENGFSDYDEINQGMLGDHFGWNESSGPNDDPGFVDPLFTQFLPTIAPTGICIYGGAALPDRYRDQILFGSFNQGEIYLLSLENPSDPRSPMSSIEKILESEDAQSRPLGIHGGIISLEEGPDGWVYFCTGGDPFGTSDIYRLKSQSTSDRFVGIRIY